MLLASSSRSASPISTSRPLRPGWPMSRADESDLHDGDELFAQDYRDQVTRLIQRLSEAEGALQAMAAGELDAVVDPASAAPILLSRAQDALARSESRH